MAQNTLIGLLIDKYQRCGNRKVAIRHKDFGIWQPYTWQDFYEHVKHFSLGLTSLGFERGEKLFIIGENDPCWVFAEFASLASGGSVVGYYADATSPELEFIVPHCDARFVVAEDQEQVDKILEIKDKIPDLKKVIYWDPKGMRNYEEPLLIRFDEIERLGREYEKSHPGVFEEMVEKVSEDDLCLISYTSGTTGLPKGAMLSNKAMIAQTNSLQQLSPITDKDELFSFAPLSWAAEQVLTLLRCLSEGATVNFCEEPETMAGDIREIGPKVMISPPRIWENIISTVQAKITDASSLKRLIYQLFIPVGYKTAAIRFSRKEPNILWKALSFLGYWILFRPLRDQVGVLKPKTAITAGAPLGPDAFKFYHALGVNFIQVYGITEAGGCVTRHRAGDVKFETVGQPFPGFEVRIASDGEILMRSASLFSGYYKNPEASQEALKGGWFYSSDIGFVDDDAHLVTFDRRADVMVLRDGTRFAPSYLESRLRFSHYIKDAIIFGDNRDYVGALISIDYANVGRWAEAHRIVYTTFTDLSQKPEVCELIHKEIKTLNRTLSAKMKVTQFANLYKELDPDEAELTRTRKLRRGFLEERYRDMVTALYGEAPEYSVETEVKYRDGRTGKMRAAVKIISLAEE